MDFIFDDVVLVVVDIDVVVVVVEDVVVEVVDCDDFMFFGG